jgi:hypothetical protein
MYQEISITNPKSRKEYRCIWCPEKILKGESHVHEVCKYEGDFQDHRWHQECWDAARKFFNENDESEFEPNSFKRGSTVEI